MVYSYINVNVDYVVSNNNDAEVDSSNYDEFSIINMYHLFKTEVITCTTKSKKSSSRIGEVRIFFFFY